MIQWNTELLSKWIAPQISEFTSAEIPDIAEEFDQSKYWFQNHFLNSALSVGFTEPYRRHFRVLVLRAQFAFAAYGGARDLTKQYLRECQPDNPKVSRYLRAVNEWENVALQFQMVVEVFNKIESLVGSSNRVFCNGDDSPEDRLYFIANNVKHAAKKIAQRKASEAESLPLWLSNAGINSYEQRSVSFSEVAEILRDVGALADDLQNPNRPT